MYHLKFCITLFFLFLFLSNEQISDAQAECVSVDALGQVVGCVIIQLPTNQVADIFIDGTLVAERQNSFNSVLIANVNHDIFIQNIQDLNANGEYELSDISQKISVQPGQIIVYTPQAEKVYVVGYLELTCRINGIQIERDIRCGVQIDDQDFGVIEHNQTRKISLMPGQHKVQLVPSGNNADLWLSAPPRVSYISLGKTTNLMSSLEQKGQLSISLFIPNAVADIWIDGTQLGTQLATTTIFLPAGSHTIEAKNIYDPSISGFYGWQDSRQIIYIRNNQTYQLVIQPAKLTFPTNNQNAKVVRVVDGDTVQVDISGKTYTVRYIGINTPETNETCGADATNFNSQLVLGKWVRLEKDISETDRYGRLLRYVYLNNVMVNNELIRLGYAEAIEYPPDTKYINLLESTENLARIQNLACYATGIFGTIQPTITPAQVNNSNCHPSYPDVCIPQGPPDIDCKDITYRNFRVLQPDSHSLDRDRDGIGCEQN